MENSPTVIESEGTSSCAIHYSESVAKRICEHYSEGISLLKISQFAEMPGYSTLVRWVKDKTEFRQMLEASRSFRALQFEDKAIETAEDARGKDADRLRFDAYKWAAEVNDPTRYGKKVTHGGDPDRPLQIVVSTGFPEPNEFQRPPVLGADGLIQRAKPVVAEVSDVDRPGDRKLTESADTQPTHGDEKAV